MAGLRFHEEALERAASDPALIATDLADDLVRAGVPFREAHGVIGSLVRKAEELGVTLTELPEEVWAEAHPAFASGAERTLAAERSIEARSLPGGTGRASVLSQIRQARSALA